MGLKTSQQGSAIIIALFVMSLVAAASVAMLSRLSVSVHRTSLILNDDKANLIAAGATYWAEETLRQNVVKQQSNHVIDAMPIQAKTETINGATIASTLYDMQAYFNLNNITTPDGRNQFLKLLQVVDTKLDLAGATEIVNSVEDWIAPSSKSQSFTDYYAAQHPPYRAAHHEMASISELRLVKGIDAKRYAQLVPFVTALPTHTAINVNTAPNEVLRSASQTLTADSAEAIIAIRKRTPFPNIEAFNKVEVVKNNSFEANKINVESNFFLLKTNVKVGQQHLAMNTLLNRETKDKVTTITILWQTKGTM